jgi:hypothetical protein
MVGRLATWDAILNEWNALKSCNRSPHNMHRTNSYWLVK